MTNTKIVWFYDNTNYSITGLQVVKFEGKYNLRKVVYSTVNTNENTSVLGSNSNYENYLHTCKTYKVEVDENVKKYF